jgi:FkbM family methyltransferase
MNSLEAGRGRAAKGLAKTVIQRSAHAFADRALATRWGRGQAFNLLSLITPTAETEVDGVRYLFGTDDRVIGRFLYTTGEWELPIMTAVCEVVADLLGAPALAGKVFVDVGANIGTAALTALGRFGATRAIALEPNPGCVRYLRLNADANGVGDVLDIVEVAASDHEGTVAFETQRANSGGGQIVTAAPLNLGGDGLTVATRRLDAVLADLGLAPGEVGLIWIDTQAYERFVLEGAGAHIDAGTPLLIEFWPLGLRHADELEPLIALLLRRFPTIVNVRSPDARSGARLRTRQDFFHVCELVGDRETDLLLWSGP